MEPGAFIFFFILAVIAAVAVGYFAYQAQKKRREELLVLTRELGWSFDPSRDWNHDEEYAHFEIFRSGHSRAAYNTMTGSMTIGHCKYPAKMGDFTYKVTSSNGKSTTTRTYNFSYLILHLPYAGMPDLLIRREGIFDKLAGVFGFADINFESAEFSRKFHVKCGDKKFAYDVVHPRMMEFLLQDCPAAVDIEHGRCCLSDGQSRWDSQEFRAMLQWAQQFFEQWPEHVIARLER